MSKDRPEEKRDLFEATGELKGGYDMGMAQAFALDHAKKTQGEYAGQGKQRVPLIWNIESSSYDEDLECFKVVLTCHPEGIQPEQKGMWEYHVRSTGGLMPGTPLLRQSLRYTLARTGKRPAWVWAAVIVLLVGIVGVGVAVAIGTVPGFGGAGRSILLPPTATPTPTTAPLPTPTLPIVARPTPAPTAAPTPRPLATATPTPTPTAAPTAVIRAATVSFNFNTLDPGDLGGNALAPWGIWVTSGSLFVSPVEPKGQVVSPGINKVAELVGPGFPKVVPTCSVLAFSSPVAAVIQATTISSFTITRIGTTGGGSYPAWRMRAFDLQGRQVGADVGEGPVPNTTGFFAMSPSPASFTVAGPSITKIEFCAHNTLSTYGSLPMAQIAYAK